MKLLYSSLEALHANTGSARRVKEHSVIVLILSQLYCLEMGGSFLFFRNEAVNFTTLQKKH